MRANNSEARKGQDKVYVLCKYNCHTPIEESKMSSHLHVCPNKPVSNAILDMIRAPDPNECYISQGQWPSRFPHTREVYNYIVQIGLKPPFELPLENEWVDVRPRTKKPKENEPKNKKFHRK